MRIQHNIPAMNAYRNFRTNNSSLSKNLEKLSSGYRINRAGDDAAGLAISEKMRAQISGLTTAQSNAKDGISLVQTAEGALTEVHDMLNRMVTLAEQSSNGTYGDDLDRVQLQKEVDQLRTEINRIADSANFNGIKLLDGSMDASNAKAASTVTTYNSTFTWNNKKTGIGTGAIAAVGSALGSNTILHAIADEAKAASFYVDLNNWTVSDAGTMSIQVGSASYANITLDGASDTKFTLEIDKGMAGSGTKLSASELTKLIADKYASATITFGSNGDKFTVSADGNRLKFQSVENTPVAIAREVEITMGGSGNEPTIKSTGSPGSKTNAAVSFAFASGVDNQTQNAFIGTTGASFGFEVSVAQKLSNACFNGNVGSVTSALGAMSMGGSTAPTLSTSLLSAGLASNVNGVAVSMGSSNSVVMTNNGVATISSSAADGVKLALSFTLQNGTKNDTVTFNVTATTVASSGSGFTTAIAAGNTGSITVAASKVTALGTKAIGLASTTGASASSIALARSTTSGGKGVVYSSAAGLTVASGASGDDTVSIRFNFGTASSKVDVTVDMALSEFGTISGNDIRFTASTVKTKLEEKFKSLFGKTEPELTASIADNGDITFTADKNITNIGTKTVALNAKVENNNGTASASGTVSFVFALNTLNSDIGNSSTLAGGQSVSVTATSANLQILGARAVVVDAVNKSGFSAASISTISLIGVDSAAASATTGGTINIKANQFTSLADTIKVGFTVGGQTMGIDLKLSDLVASNANVSAATTATASTVKGAIVTKLKSLFTESKTIANDAVDIASDTVTVTFGTAPTGYKYWAKQGANGAWTSVATTTTGTAPNITTFSALTLATASTPNRAVVGSDGILEIRVVASNDINADNPIGSFKIDVSSLTATASKTVYAKSATVASAVTDTTLTISMTAAANSGGGDYNTSTEAIIPGVSEDSGRLASTRLWVKVSATSANDTDTDGKLANVFYDKIKDGAAMRIGDQNFIFAVGSKSKISADENGSILVDLKDIGTSTSGFVAASQGLSSKALNIALKRLTVAAKDNAMFGVGFDEESEEFTLTENAGYYTGSNVLLNTAAKIAAQIDFGTVSQKATTEDVEEVKANDLTLQIGDTSDEFNQLKVSIKDMHTDAIGIGTIDISTQAGAQAAVDKIKSAINYVSDVRGTLGATQNRLEHTINNLSVMVENITDAESTIRDTDIAEEMMAYTKNSILNQAAQAMLAQANQLPQGVLQLLG